MVHCQLLFALMVLATAASATSLKLSVHMARVHSEEQIESEFVSRSTPGSPNFRQFLKLSELRNLVGARESSIKAVTTYFTLRGAQEVRLLSTGDIITCTIDRTLAEELGYAGSSGRIALSVPSTLRDHVRHFILNAAATKRPTKKPLGAGQPGAEQTPVTIAARYNIPSTPPSAPANYSQGVAEFEGEYFAETDIAAFVAEYGFENVTIPLMGPNTPSTNADSTEGTLDLEYMASVSGGRIKTWWLAQSGDNSDPGNIDFSTWADAVLNLSPMPYVVSISWGMGYERYDFAESVLFTDNDAFRKMGMMGVSVFAASGDSGPGVRSEIFNCKTFTPSWPASSPYLTSVGATYADSTTSNETAVSWSGGGFSTVFARPSYQSAAVAKYLQHTSNLPKASFYNASGRGYPDVSALGTNYRVYVQGQWSPVSGTSCASPTFAGIVSLIVSERLSSGSSSLGFLNPSLYGLGKVGFDVTAGQSQDSNCIPFVPIAGFPAVSGWDAVSGLGTPDYEYLRSSL